MARPKGGKNNLRSAEEKESILNEYLENHESLIKVGRKYNIDISTLKRWRRKYRENGIKSFERQGLSRSEASMKPKTEEERLKRIVISQEIEIARLKRGYQVNGSGVQKEYATMFDENTK
jgi:transposase-like protein